jgi:putative FmdB family regulatory protein
MPLYEYSCHRCGKTFEVRQKFADEPLTTHEECGGEVERLLSAPALQFKGTGWYVTDYARNGKGSNGSDKSDKSDKKSKSDGKTESKTESKSESKTESKSESKPTAPASSS